MVENIFIEPHNQTYNDARFSLFMQRLCEKHEYIKVTQTATSTNTTEKINPVTWFQCKHCGKILGS